MFVFQFEVCLRYVCLVACIELFVLMLLCANVELNLKNGVSVGPP